MREREREDEDLGCLISIFEICHLLPKCFQNTTLVLEIIFKTC